MVLDSSAIVAILRGEAERQVFVTALLEAADPVVSTATVLESSIVMAGRIGIGAADRVDELLDQAGVRLVSVDVTQMEVARQAFLRYGKGRHAAALTYGDCFSYALARTMDRPLLFKGSDFSLTDVRSAA